MPAILNVFIWIVFPFLFLAAATVFLIFIKHAISESEYPDGTLPEASQMAYSKSKDWWLSSGGIMRINGSEFSTNIGPLPDSSKWQKIYEKTNSQDTEGGKFPQNIFRLVYRKQFKNISQSVYFQVLSYNKSDSANKNESNGILLFNRYADDDNLYYAGLRVDGNAVIKKKIGGTYYTIAEKKIMSGNYDRETSLIPKSRWIGLKSQVRNKNNKIEIKVFLDMRGQGNWVEVLEASDEKGKYGDCIFLAGGYSGIRSDFMDVRFKEYKANEL